MVSSNTKLTKNTDISLVTLNLQISITGALMLVYQQHVNFFLFRPIRIQKTLETGEGKRGLKMEDKSLLLVLTLRLGATIFVAGPTITIQGAKILMS